MQRNRRCKYIDLLTIHKEGWAYLHATQTQSPLYSTEIWCPKHTHQQKRSWFQHTNNRVSKVGDISPGTRIVVVASLNYTSRAILPCYTSSPILVRILLMGLPMCFVFTIIRLALALPSPYYQKLLLVISPSHRAISNAMSRSNPSMMVVKPTPLR